MKTKLEFFQTLKTDHTDISDYIYTEDDANSIHSFEDLRHQLERHNAIHVDITYYSEAMKYLTEHDTSLKGSLDIAAEMGRSVESLSSEMLASLLATRINIEQIEMLREEVE